MRNLKCFDVHGVSVDELLVGFNDQADEFGIAEEDVISIKVLPAEAGHMVVRDGTKPITNLTRLVIFYWSSR
ncbi:MULTISPECIES: hypothetical protein [unclassified Rhizobacter]|uniref:hypothetical protein n=1 Tax=unclassified Rhizobacter TaxID=2640088 RepID=UPI0006F43B5B|nr:MULTISPECIES: hypothetical protein [unclassified Rhizobacter]KQU69126.1 hypothetical protein ASC88_28750 [Rhizobacter sp. Root29]KQW03930.1 hypothetical protein ASC98_26920 [Rhizobacter sp. Root1238]KRB21571.1 hypothetical protein ASE08_21605 [Rhizobacter sp. Root16D2]